MALAYSRQFPVVSCQKSVSSCQSPVKKKKAVEENVAEPKPRLHFCFTKLEPPGKTSVNPGGWATSPNPLDVDIKSYVYYNNRILMSPFMNLILIIRGVDEEGSVRYCYRSESKT